MASVFDSLLFKDPNVDRSKETSVSGRTAREREVAIKGIRNMLFGDNLNIQSIEKNNPEYQFLKDPNKTLESRIDELISSKQFTDTQAKKAQLSTQGVRQGLSESERRINQEYDKTAQELPETLFSEFNKRGMFRDSRVQQSLADSLTEARMRRDSNIGQIETQRQQLAGAESDMIRQRQDELRTQLQGVTDKGFEQQLQSRNIVDVGGNRQLINTITGNVIKDLGVTGAPANLLSSGIFDFIDPDQSGSDETIRALFQSQGIRVV